MIPVQRIGHRARTLALISLSVMMTACSTPQPRTFLVPAGRYSEALAATREALRAAGYTIERVDARAGEVTTSEKTVAGLATPFQPENRSASGLLSDSLSDRPRTVRVRFRDAANPSAPPRAEAEVLAEIDAIIWKRLNPGWQINTETTRGNTVSRDPLLLKRGVSGATPVPLGRDDDFAGVLAARILDRLAATIDNEQPAQ